MNIDGGDGGEVDHGDTVRVVLQRITPREEIPSEPGRPTSETLVGSAPAADAGGGETTGNPVQSQ